MGKVRKLRKKFHLSSKEESKNKKIGDVYHTRDTLSLKVPDDYLFPGPNINLKELPEDLQSVKSMKSVKLNPGLPGRVSKKARIKLRREMLLKRIDTINQMKKQQKIREKRKNIAVIGDTNPLHDALPSLDEFFKSSVKNRTKQTTQKQTKSIEKAKKREKKFIQGISVFKQLMNNSALKTNPFETINQYIMHSVLYEHTT